MTNDDFITIQAKVPRKRVLTVAYNRTGDQKIPSIRFSGTWLDSIGFSIGNSFDAIINSDGTITLRAHEPGEVAEDDEAGVEKISDVAGE